jgi:hypothetical protein
MTTTVTNKTKSATVTATNKSKNTVNVGRRIKGGASYGYGEDGYGYGDDFSQSGEVFYGQVGTAPTITNKIKH